MVSKDKRKGKYCHVAGQIFLIKWDECSFLGDNFRVVEKGMKWCSWCYLIVDAACEIGCCVVPECSILFLLLGLCRRPGWLL